jgi:hypothetical protein
MRDIDIFFAASKKAFEEGRPGDILKYALADGVLLFGIIMLIGMIAFFLHVYIWPTVNPFQFQWFSNLWDWIGSPRPPTAEETYPHAKVLYRETPR